MRRALMVMVLVCMAGACNDDDDSPTPGDASTPVDAATDASTPIDSSTPIDASAPDAAAPRSLLPRWGTLERPPTALPDELKPPG
jgi:hypothetical protein